jgi:hypothetical protein
MLSICTLKTQVIIERNSLQIIDVQEAKGSEHDFKVYKDTTSVIRFRLTQILDTWE